MAKWVVGLALACAGLGCSKTNPEAASQVRIADGGLPQPDVDGGLPVDNSTPDLGDSVVIFHPRDMATGNPFGAADLAGLDLAGLDLAGLDLAGTPPGCGTTASQPVSWYQQANVALNASGPLPITIPDGVALRGTVSLPSLPAGATFNSGLIQWTDPSGNYSKTETVVPGTDGKSFSYSVVLAPGTYSMATRLTLQLPGVLYLSRYAADTATLCEVTTHDMPLPAVPPLSTVPVTVKNFVIDPPSDPAVPLTVIVYMENLAHTFITAVQASLSNGTATLSMQLPSDTFVPAVLFGESDKVTAPQKSGYETVVSLPSAAPAARYDLTLPTLVKMTGSLTSTSGLTTTGNPASFQCLDTTGANDIKETQLGDILAASPSYRVYARSGQSCLPTEVFLVQMGAATSSTSANSVVTLLTFPQGDSPVTLSADTVNNLTLPSLGAPIAIAGQLRDASGAGLPSRLVTATGAPANGLDAVVVATVHSDASGNFTLNVPPGTYDFEITTYDK
jgi:hypothetical protein